MNTQNIKLEAMANSGSVVPAFEKSELDGLIKKYGAMVDWKTSREILSIEISLVPPCEFIGLY